MPVSEAQKRASNKYQATHMATLGCKVKKHQAAAFKEHAAQRGKTSNTMLKEYVLDCIGEGETMERDTQAKEPEVIAVQESVNGLTNREAIITTENKSEPNANQATPTTKREPHHCAKGWFDLLASGRSLADIAINGIYSKSYIGKCIREYKRFFNIDSNKPSQGLIETWLKLSDSGISDKKIAEMPESGGWGPITIALTLTKAKYARNSKPHA